VELTEKLSSVPEISPGGKWVGYASLEDVRKPWKLAVFLSRVTGWKSFDLATTADPSAGIRWTLDGRGLTYVDTRKGRLEHRRHRRDDRSDPPQ